MTIEPPHPALLLGYRRRKKPQGEPTVHDIERGLHDLACLIRDLGEEEGAKYLCHFERLETELATRRARSAVHNRALALAAGA